MAIFKKSNFFSKACFLHPGNQVFVYDGYVQHIFSSCDIMSYLYVKYIIKYIAIDRFQCLHNFRLRTSKSDIINKLWRQ